MKVSIVIPSYDNFNLVNNLLADLNNHTKADEIIVVDDCSSDYGTIDGLTWWHFNAGIKIKRTPENLGFLKASNFGMAQATGDILVLVSTDVIVRDDLVKLVKDALKENSKRLIGGIVYNGSTGWNQFGQRVFPYTEGWLLACTKEAWNEFGGFDERYAPFDFEDVDLSTTAISKGYELFSLNNPKIRHIGAQTIKYGEQREEQTRKNVKKFEMKWVTASDNATAKRVFGEFSNPNLE